MRRRRAVRDRAATTTRGRSTRAPAARSGAIAASCPTDLNAVLRRRQPRLRRARRSAVHDDARRAPARARHEDRRASSGTSTLDDYKNGYAATVAPLVVKDKVIVGIAGGEYGIRGFIDAYDAQTGKRAWRFYTVPGPGEPGSETWPRGDAYLRGGGSIWVTGTYDPELNLVFYGTGNPGPDYYSDAARATTSTPLARRARRRHRQAEAGTTSSRRTTCTTGTRRRCRCSADLTIDGQPRKVVMFANRNGFFYTLDRVTGKVIVAQAVRRDDLGEGDRRRRPAGAAARAHLPDEDGDEDLPGSPAARTSCRRRYDPTTRPVLRDRARNVRDVLRAASRSSSRASGTPAAARSGRAIRRTSARCARSIRRPATEVGVPLHVARRRPAC